MALKGCRNSHRSGRHYSRNWGRRYDRFSCHHWGCAIVARIVVAEVTANAPAIVAAVAVAVAVAREHWTPPWSLLWLPQLAAAMTSAMVAAIATVITAVIGHRFFDRRYCRHRSHHRVVHHLVSHEMDLSTTRPAAMTFAIITNGTRDCCMLFTVEYMRMCQNVRLCGIRQQTIFFTEEKSTKPSQSLQYM